MVNEDCAKTVGTDKTHWTFTPDSCGKTGVVTRSLQSVSTPHATMVVFGYAGNLESHKVQGLFSGSSVTSKSWWAPGLWPLLNLHSIPR